MQANISLLQQKRSLSKPVGSKFSIAGRPLRHSRSNGFKWQAAQWLQTSAKCESAVPLEVAWTMWNDTESLPRWMPWVKEVKVLPEDPRLSRWLLSTDQFGRTWQLSWVSRHLAPIHHQKIHWRSVPGSSGGVFGNAITVDNRGEVRFFKRSPRSCAVELTIYYEVPDPLVPFANALNPVVQGILNADMQRFSKYAVQQCADVEAKIAAPARN